MYILTDKYGLKRGNVIAIEDDLDTIFEIAEKNKDSLLHIGGFEDEETEKFLPE